MFIDRLDKALESLTEEPALGGIEIFEAISDPPTDPVVIDMGSRAQRNAALHNCRAPHLGWDEYESGQEYVPPMYFDSNVPLGPPADESNPHAETHGGVRPWSIAELIETLTSPGGFAYGLIGRMFGGYTKNMRDELAVGSLVNLAAEVVSRKIFQDQGRSGVRFTTYIFRWLHSGMAKGISPGYRNEYRESQGLINYWDRVLTQAISAARTDEEPELQTFHDAILIGGESQGRSGVVQRTGVNDIDPVNGPKNPWGDLAERLHGVGTLAAGAISSGDVGQMSAARQALRNTKTEVGEEANTRRSRGAFFDTLVDPKAKVTSFTMKGDDEKEIERTDIATDTGAQERQRHMDTMRRLLVIGRKGIYPPYMMVDGIVDQALEIVSNPPKIEDFAIEEIATDARPSYNIMSPTGRVVETHDDPEDAREALEAMNPRKAQAHDIMALIDHIGEQYGDFAEELRGDFEDLSSALVSNDPRKLMQSVQVLDLHKEEAKERQEEAMTKEREGLRAAGKRKRVPVKYKKEIVRPITDVEYRIALRFFNIVDYPERGTDKDPEIINGEESDWVKNGFPKMRKFEIAKDLGYSKVRISTAYNNLITKINGVSQAMFGHGLQTESVLPSEILYEDCYHAIIYSLVEFHSEYDFDVILG